MIVFVLQTRYLSSIGGKDLPDVVRRVLSAIATQSVACLQRPWGEGKETSQEYDPLQCHIT